MKLLLHLGERHRRGNLEPAHANYITTELLIILLTHITAECEQTSECIKICLCSLSDSQKYITTEQLLRTFILVITFHYAIHTASSPER